MIPEEGQAQLDPALLLFLLFLRRFRLGQGIIIAPVFGIFFQNPQPLESFFIGVISNLAEQLVGVLLKIQQIIYIHQDIFGLFIPALFQVHLKSVEGTDAVRISLCLAKLFLELNVSF